MKNFGQKHILVVGGSGMLADVTRHFAIHVKSLSVIGRSYVKLDRLLNSNKRYAGVEYNPISLDYSNSSKLRQRITEAITEYGPIEYVAAWIHKNAPEAHTIISELLNLQKIESKYFEIVGSADKEEALGIEATEAEITIEALDNVLYRKIILGHRKLNGRTRWLTEQEICGGVIDAVVSDREVTIVGELK